MAQLKNTLISGSARVTGALYANTLSVVNTEMKLLSLINTGTLNAVSTVDGINLGNASTTYGHIGVDSGALGLYTSGTICLRPNVSISGTSWTYNTGIKISSTEIIPSGTVSLGTNVAPWNTIFSNNYVIKAGSQYYISKQIAEYQVHDPAIGWARPGFRFIGPNNELISQIGVLGTDDDLTYTYIGSGEYGATNNLRIYPSGDVTATTFNGLTFSPKATGFSIAGGTTSKTLTVSDTAIINAPTQWGIVYGGASGAYTSTAAGTSGQYLKSNGSAAPTWADFPVATASAKGIMQVGTGLSVSSGTVSIDGINTSAGSTTKCLTEKGTWTTFGTSNLELGSTSSTAATGDHNHDTVYLKNTTTTISSQANLANKSGCALFSGTGICAIGNDSTTDWAVLQVGYANDKWQITTLSGHLYIRENDTGGTNSANWTNWIQAIDRTYLDTTIPSTIDAAHIPSTQAVVDYVASNAPRIEIIRL